MKQITSEELVHVVSQKIEEPSPTSMIESFQRLNITCWFCRNFKLKFSPWDYSGHRVIFTNEDGETGLQGTCLRTSEKTTSLDIACEHYDYAYATQRFCSDLAIFNDAAVNDDCRGADFNCDNCFTKEFWEEVLEEKDKHFKGDKPHDQMGLYSVYSFVPSGVEGGFGGDRFNIQLDTGETFTDVGLWHRGFCPNDEIVKQFRTGQIELRRRM
jgi:hypothetical protein